MAIVEAEFPQATAHGASSLELALKSIAQQEYELIVLDPGLPGVPPHNSVARINVVSTVREAAPEARILIMTGSDDVDEAVAFRTAGADAYVAKTGMSRTKLLEQLRRMEPNRYPVKLADTTANHVEVSFSRLTGREREIAEILTAASPDRKRKDVYEDAAAQLGIDAESIRTYIKRIRRKLPTLAISFNDDD